MKDPKLYMSSNILSHLKIPILNRILSMKLLKRNDNIPPKKSEKQKIRCRITLPIDPETNSPENNSYGAKTSSRIEQVRRQKENRILFLSGTIRACLSQWWCQVQTKRLDCSTQRPSTSRNDSKNASSRDFLGLKCSEFIALFLQLMPCVAGKGREGSVEIETPSNAVLWHPFDSSVPRLLKITICTTEKWGENFLFNPRDKNKKIDWSVVIFSQIFHPFAKRERIFKRVKLRAVVRH